MIIPCGLVQKKQVPIRKNKADTRQSVLEAKRDAACSQKHDTVYDEHPLGGQRTQPVEQWKVALGGRPVLDIGIGHSALIRYVNHHEHAKQDTKKSKR